MEWALMPLRKYAEFTGRARRKEYWSFVLLILVAAIAISLVEGALGLSGMVGPYGPLSALLLLGTLVPGIAVGIRRLHDTNRSGWWLLVGYGPMCLSMLVMFGGIQNLGLAGILSVVGMIGGIVLLVFMVLEGTRGPNQYGPDPKGGEGATAAA
jgi:uncharacterized membrane protein YhaH (DUF805 family)